MPSVVRDDAGSFAGIGLVGIRAVRTQPGGTRRRPVRVMRGSVLGDPGAAEERSGPTLIGGERFLGRGYRALSIHLAGESDLERDPLPK